MHTIANPIAPMPERTAPGGNATPIAIVGLACRFPDADDPLALFESEWSMRLAGEWNPRLTFEPFGARGLVPAAAS